MIRGGRILAIGVFIVAVAVMPLGGLLSGGVFETWLPAQYGRGPVRVFVHDQTGLISGAATFAASATTEVSNPSGNQRVLAVYWSACGVYQVDLTFARAETGYRIEGRPTVLDCWFFTPTTDGTTVLSLRAPVDASTVRFQAAP